MIYRLRADWNTKTIRITKAEGQTNRNYIVEHKRKKFFVRLPWESNVIDRAIEGKNIFALANNKKLASVLPTYYCYVLRKKNILDPRDTNVFLVPDGTMIASYIEGKEYSLELFKKEKYQKLLAKACYAFHASGVRFVNTYDVFRDEIQKYRIAGEKYPLQEITDIETITAFKKLEKQAKKKLLPLKRSMPAHNDFIFQNFLLGKNNTVYLLDFEYAGLSMRGGVYYDFGFLFADNLFRRPRMTTDLFEQFLSIADKIYKKKLDRGQIYAAAQAVVIMQFWWGILRYFYVETKKEKQYFKKYVQARGQKIPELAKTLPN